jgi:hypothetical protein
MFWWSNTTAVSGGEWINMRVNFKLIAQDHRYLVEQDCDDALAVLYSDRLCDLYLKKGEIITSDGLIVVEVCGGSGGSGVNVDLLYQ